MENERKLNKKKEIYNALSDILTDSEDLGMCGHLLGVALQKADLLVEFQVVRSQLVSLVLKHLQLLLLTKRLLQQQQNS